MKLYEFFTDAKNYYLVTEFVEGGELFDEIQKRGTLTEDLSADIMRQLLSAII